MDEVGIRVVLLTQEADLNLVCFIPVSHLWTLLSRPLNWNIPSPIMLINYQVLDLAPGISVHY